MTDANLTNAQLLEELNQARRQISDLEDRFMSGATGFPSRSLHFLKNQPAKLADKAGAAIDLSAIVDIPALQKLMDEFHLITQIGAAILDNTGRVLVASGWQDICTRFHRGHPQASQNCRESDLFLTGAPRQGQFVAYKCKNNLWDVSTPLYVAGQHVGGIYTGQFFYDDELVDEPVFCEQAERYGFEPAAYLEALQRVPRFSRASVDNIMQFLVSLSILVSEVGLRNFDLAHSMLAQLRMARSLSENENLLHATLNATADGILVVDKQGKVAKLNSLFATMWRLPAQLVTSTDNEALIAYCLAQVREPHTFLTKVQDLNDSSHNGAGEVELKDGRVLEYLSSPIIDDGREMGRIWDFKDVTTNRRAAAALRKSQQEYRNLFENSVVGMIRSRLDGLAVLEVNQAFCDLFGYRREELLLNPALDCWADPLARAAMIDLLRRQGVVTNFEMNFVKQDGEIRIGLLSMKLYAQADFMEGSIIDITERRREQEDKHKLQAQLFQAQKMESLGTLAGGIAHDFNNILTGIMGFGELAREELPDSATATGYLDEVLKASERAKALVRQILTFSRRVNAEVVAVQPQQVAQEALQLLRASIPATIAIEHAIDPQTATILADPSQFHQVIMNLCTNAYAAMPTGGALTLKLRNCQIDAENVRNYLELNTGPYICLSVSDTGCGMDAATIPHIFEPFFTTKPKGEGTGLGLATVHGIVKALKGDITVYSEPDLGTTFNVYIPALAAETPVMTAPLATVAGRGELILLVDDEEAILKLGRLMLEKLGFTVEAYSNPQAALQAFRANPAAFALVITDYAMPGMNGAQLTKAILSLKPATPIIVASGFAYEISENWLKDSGIATFIEKPFNRGALCQAIGACLN